MKIEVRLATSDDDEEISKLSVIVWQQAYTDIFSEEFLVNLKWQPRVKGRKKFFEDTTKTSFVAILDQKIVGFCDFGSARIEETITDLDLSSGEIYAIYVLPKYQNHGVGTSLYIAAIEQLQKLKFKSLIIWTLAANKPAIAFYLKRGCNMTSWHKSFKAEGQEYTEIALSCNLAEVSK